MSVHEWITYLRSIGQEAFWNEALNYEYEHRLQNAIDLCMHLTKNVDRILPTTHIKTVEELQCTAYFLCGTGIMADTSTGYGAIIADLDLTACDWIDRGAYDMRKVTKSHRHDIVFRHGACHEPNLTLTHLHAIEEEPQILSPIQPYMCTLRHDLLNRESGRYVINLSPEAKVIFDNYFRQSITIPNMG